MMNARQKQTFCDAADVAMKGFAPDSSREAVHASVVAVIECNRVNDNDGKGEALRRIGVELCRSLKKPADIARGIVMQTINAQAGREVRLPNIFVTVLDPLWDAPARLEQRQSVFGQVLMAAIVVMTAPAPKVAPQPADKPVRQKVPLEVRI
jgi:hypothetical protein